MSTPITDDEQLNQWVKSVTGAERAIADELVQELWSGYGQIIRNRLDGGQNNQQVPSSVIVKYVNPPSLNLHPRGWNTSTSHERKLCSYLVEANWYQHWSRHCPARVANCLAVASIGDQSRFILEDLNSAGFNRRFQRPSQAAFDACIAWLAQLHGYFLSAEPKGLWPVGSYWHLATRQDEFQAMAECELKINAELIDNKLNRAIFQTLIHGDAKVANFCFSEAGDAVAAVDFQYIGGGCGMKDLAYFVGSVLDANQCQQQEQAILALYFSQLKTSIAKYHPAIDGDAVETEWRALYPFAWADFERFLLGWMPGHHKLNKYSASKTEQALSSL